MRPAALTVHVGRRYCPRLVAFTHQVVYVLPTHTHAEVLSFTQTLHRTSLHKLRHHFYYYTHLTPSFPGQPG